MKNSVEANTCGSHKKGFLQACRETFKKAFENFKIGRNNNLSAFTAGELFITLGVLGALAIILIPVLLSAKPDELDALHKKSVYVTERILNELSTDEYLYPHSDNMSGLSNTSAVKVNGVTHAGATKFCTLFASRLTLKEGTEVNCTNGALTAVSVEGIHWYLPITSFQNGAATLTVDLNGDEEPNQKGKDQFEYTVMPGLKYEPKLIPALAGTGTPPPEDNRDESATPPENDPRPAGGLYTISCSGSSQPAIFIGAGSGKPNGNYQLVAIPRKGQKCSWFTKQVTIKDADIAAGSGVCDITCSSALDVPKNPYDQEDGGDDDDVECDPTVDPTCATYCIDINITGDETGCTVEGLGCDLEARTTHTITVKGNSNLYEPSWTEQAVTVVDRDIVLDVECKKKEQVDVTFSPVHNCGASQVIDQTKNNVSLTYTSENVTGSVNLTSAVLYGVATDIVDTSFTLSAPATLEFCDAVNYTATGCVAPTQTCTFTAWMAGGTVVSTSATFTGTVDKNVTTYNATYTCDRCDLPPGEFNIYVDDSVVRRYIDAFTYIEMSKVGIATDNPALSGLKYTMTGKNESGASLTLTAPQIAYENKDKDEGKLEYWVQTVSTCPASVKSFSPTNYKVLVGNTIAYNQTSQINGADVSINDGNKYTLVFNSSASCVHPDGTPNPACEPPAPPTIMLNVDNLSIKNTGNAGSNVVPTVDRTANTIKVKGGENVTVSGIAVQPSDLTKEWVIKYEETSGWGPTTTTGTGAQTFDVNIPHASQPATMCLYAEYKDVATCNPDGSNSSIKSEKFCFEYEKVAPNNCSLSFTSTGDMTGDPTGKCSATKQDGTLATSSLFLNADNSYSGKIEKLTCDASYKIECVGTGDSVNHKLTPNPTDVTFTNANTTTPVVVTFAAAKGDIQIDVVMKNTDTCTLDKANLSGIVKATGPDETHEIPIGGANQGKVNTRIGQYDLQELNLKYNGASLDAIKNITGCSEGVEVTLAPTNVFVSEGNTSTATLTIEAKEVPTIEIVVPDTPTVGPASGTNTTGVGFTITSTADLITVSGAQDAKVGTFKVVPSVKNRPWDIKTVTGLTIDPTQGRGDANSVSAILNRDTMADNACFYAQYRDSQIISNKVCFKFVVSNPVVDIVIDSKNSDYVETNAGVQTTGVKADTYYMTVNTSIPNFNVLLGGEVKIDCKEHSIKATGTTSIDRTDCSTGTFKRNDSGVTSSTPYVVRSQYLTNAELDEYKFTCMTASRCKITIAGHEYDCNVGTVTQNNIDYKITYKEPTVDCTPPVSACSPSNTYDVTITETCDGCDAGDATTLLDGKPYWTSNPALDAGAGAVTGTLAGGTNWTLTFKVPEWKGVIDGKQYIAKIKSVTVNDKAASTDKYSAKVCKPQNVTIVYEPEFDPNAICKVHLKGGACPNEENKTVAEVKVTATDYSQQVDVTCGETVTLEGKICGKAVKIEPRYKNGLLSTVTADPATIPADTLYTETDVAINFVETICNMVFKPGTCVNPDKDPSTAKVTYGEGENEFVNVTCGGLPEEIKGVCGQKYTFTVTHTGGYETDVATEPTAMESLPAGDTNVNVVFTAKATGSVQMTFYTDATEMRSYGFYIDDVEYSGNSGWKNGEYVIIEDVFVGTHHLVAKECTVMMGSISRLYDSVFTYNGEYTDGMEFEVAEGTTTKLYLRCNAPKCKYQFIGGTCPGDGVTTALVKMLREGATEPEASTSLACGTSTEPVKTSCMLPATFSAAYESGDPATVSVEPESATIDQIAVSYPGVFKINVNFAGLYKLTIKSPATGEGSPEEDVVTEDLEAGEHDISAEPAAGYEFDKWSVLSDEGTCSIDHAGEKETVVNITRNCIIQPSYKKSDLLLTVETVENGTVEVQKDGVVKPSPVTTAVGEVFDLTATPDKGYVFAGWTSEGGCTFADATQATTTLTMGPTDCTISAAFERKAVKLTVTNDEFGDAVIIVDSNTYKSYDTVFETELNVKTFPITGYDINKWTRESGDCTINNPTGSETAVVMGAEDCTIKATHVKLSSNLTVASDEQGTAKIDGTNATTVELKYDETKKIIATPNTGYQFSHWDIEGQCTVEPIDNATATVTMKVDDCTVTAKYEIYTSTLKVFGGEYGEAYIDGTPGLTEVQTEYAREHKVDITMQEGHNFSAWSVKGDCTLSSTTDKSITVTMGIKDCEISAASSIDLTVESGEHGTAYIVVEDATNTTTTTVETAASANHTVVAVSDKGYELDTWERVSGDCQITGSQVASSGIIMGITNCTVKAIHAKKKMKLTITAGPNGDAGIVGSGGTLSKEVITEFEASHEIKATPADGYKFLGWTITGDGDCALADASAAETTVTMGELACEIAAEFSNRLIVSSDENGTAKIKGEETLNLETKNGAEHTIVSTPNEGYDFTGWTVEGDCTLGDSTLAETTVTMGANNCSVKATHGKKKVKLTVETDERGTVTIDGSTTNPVDTEFANEHTIKVTPIAGQNFLSWERSEGDCDIKSPNALESKVTMGAESCTIKATYQAKACKINLKTSGSSKEYENTPVAKVTATPKNSPGGVGSQSWEIASGETQDGIDVTCDDYTITVEHASGETVDVSVSPSAISQSDFWEKDADGVDVWVDFVASFKLKVYYFKEGNAGYNVADPDVFTYKDGETWTATAKAIEGWIAVEPLEKTGTIDSSDAEAVFFYKPDTVKLTVTSSGSCTVGIKDQTETTIEVDKESAHTVSGIPIDGYDFTGWTVQAGGDCVLKDSTSEETVVTIGKTSCTVVASCSRGTVKLNWTVNNKSPEGTPNMNIESSNIVLQKQDGTELLVNAGGSFSGPNGFRTGFFNLEPDDFPVTFVGIRDINSKTDPDDHGFTASANPTKVTLPNSGDASIVIDLTKIVPGCDTAYGLKFTMSQVDHGTAIPESKTGLCYGQSFDVEATPDDGYEFNGWQVVSSSYDCAVEKTTDAKTKLTMGKTDCVLAPSFKASTGSLTLKFLTNAEKVESYDINIGDIESTGSAGWASGESVTIDDIPVGEQELSVNGCTLTGGVESESTTIDPTKVTIKKGLSAIATLTCEGETSGNLKLKIATDGARVDEIRMDIGDSPWYGSTAGGWKNSDTETITGLVVGKNSLSVSSCLVRETATSEAIEGRPSVSPASVTIYAGETSEATVSCLLPEAKRPKCTMTYGYRNQAGNGNNGGRSMEVWWTIECSEGSYEDLDTDDVSICAKSPAGKVQTCHTVAPTQGDGSVNLNYAGTGTTEETNGTHFLEAGFTGGNENNSDLTLICDGTSCTNVQADTITLTASNPLTAVYGGTNTTGTTPTATKSGNNITVEAAQDVTVGTFTVTPSNPTKSWSLVDDGEIWSGWGPSADNGVGTRDFTVTLSRNHFQSSCLHAKYDDNSNKSEKLCFTLNDNTPAVDNIKFVTNADKVAAVKYQLNGGTAETVIRGPWANGETARYEDFDGATSFTVTGCTVRLGESETAGEGSATVSGGVITVTCNVKVSDVYVYGYIKDTTTKILDKHHVGSYPTGESVTVTPPDVEGYVPVPGQVESFDMPAYTKNITFYYTVEKATLEVTTDGNGSAWIGDVTSVTKVDPATVNQSYEINASPADGYKFKEWNAVGGSCTFIGGTDATAQSTTVKVTAADDCVVKASFEEDTPEPTTGALQITFKTDAEKVTAYDILIGETESAGSAGWANNATVTINDLPAGKSNLTVNGCTLTGDVEAENPSFSPSSVTIVAGETATATLTCNAPTIYSAYAAFDFDTTLDGGYTALFDSEYAYVKFKNDDTGEVYTLTNESIEATVPAGSYTVTEADMTATGAIVDSNGNQTPHFQFEAKDPEASPETFTLSTSNKSQEIRVTPNGWRFGPVNGEYITLTMETSTGCTAIPEGITNNLTSNQEVQIQATANSGYTFSTWELVSGDCSIKSLTSTSTTVTMQTGNCTIKPVCTATAMGKIDIDLVINDGGTCTLDPTKIEGTVKAKKTTLLGETPTSYSIQVDSLDNGGFDGIKEVKTGLYGLTADITYNGGSLSDIAVNEPGCSEVTVSMSPLNLSVKADETIKANLTLTAAEAETSECNYKLKTGLTLNGTATVDKSEGLCKGDIVQIGAMPDGEYTFSNWNLPTMLEGGCTITDRYSAKTTVTMSAADCTVTPTFTNLGTDETCDIFFEAGACPSGKSDASATVQALNINDSGGIDGNKTTVYCGAITKPAIRVMCSTAYSLTAVGDQTGVTATVSPNKISANDMTSSNQSFVANVNFDYTPTDDSGDATGPVPVTVNFSFSKCSTGVSEATGQVYLYKLGGDYNDELIIKTIHTGSTATATTEIERGYDYTVHQISMSATCKDSFDNNSIGTVYYNTQKWDDLAPNGSYTVTTKGSVKAIIINISLRNESTSTDNPLVPDGQL